MRGLLLLLLLLRARAGLPRNGTVARNGTVGGSGPVTVFISVVPVQVAKIDVTVQNVFFDSYVTFSWQDEAVAECGPEGNGELPGHSDWAAWTPAAEFINVVEDGTGSRDIKQVYCGQPIGAPPSWGADHWINFYGRITGTFVAQMQMSDFPQDTQTVVLRIESYMHDDTALTWQFLPLYSQPFMHTAWFFRGESATVTPNYYAPFDLTYSQANYQVRLQRNPRSYYTRYVLNIMLLVALSLLGAILSPLETSRIMLSVTLFLGVVSWMFVLVTDAPKSDQPTRMDHFFIASFVVLLLQALYFTLRNHNYDATLAPLPFWKGWLERHGKRSDKAAGTQPLASSSESAPGVRRRRGRVVRSRSMAPPSVSPPSTECVSPPSMEEGGAAAPSLPLNPDLATDAGKEEVEEEEGEAGAARSGTREQQEAEFVMERVRESMVVNLFLFAAYGIWVACIFWL